jgi:tRNA 2-thiouridine synthesizing protein E
MTVATIADTAVDLDDEGFLTDHTQWNEQVAAQLAANIGIELTDEHWKVIRFVRSDYEAEGETPTLRRVTNVAGIPTKELFKLFPKKPAKKMSYVAGVPKPVGCV